LWLTHPGHVSGSAVVVDEEVHSLVSLFET
jgi:hypothetical protein